MNTIKVILVTGSRNPSTRAISELRSALFDHGPQIIIHGGARGEDAVAERWARENGALTKVMRPDYKKNGPRVAPLIRNEDMVRVMTKIHGTLAASGRFENALIDAQVCLAAPMPDSRGTFHCMRAAEKAGLTVVNVTGVVL